jgi:glutamate-1-semialdehyde aminotransferase
MLEDRFHSGIDAIIKDLDLTMVVPHHGARFDIVLGRRDEPVRYEDTFTHKPEIMVEIVRECLRRGVYFHDYGGAPVHHGYSVQHSREDIDTVLGVLEEMFGILKKRGGLS